jgi:hypothetical protein
MPSHMGVQSFATTRNSQIELFIESILEAYFELTKVKSRVSRLKIESQKPYKSEISSDVWDHFVSFFDSELGKEVELWCQTTSYKGNKSGNPEPNKTYEIRETLVEAISIREKVETYGEKIIRTIHFTVGSKKYTYDWFVAAKDKTFDLSIYLNFNDGDIFKIISEVIGSAKTDVQVKNSIRQAFLHEGPCRTLLEVATNEIGKWHLLRNCMEQEAASMQYTLVKAEIDDRQEEINISLERSINAGRDIKKRCNDLVNGKHESDELIIKTTNQLLDNNLY